MSLFSPPIDQETPRFSKSTPIIVLAFAPLAAVSESPMAAITSMSPGMSRWTDVGDTADFKFVGHANLCSLADMDGLLLRESKLANEPVPWLWIKLRNWSLKPPLWPNTFILNNSTVLLEFLKVEFLTWFFTWTGRDQWKAQDDMKWTHFFECLEIKFLFKNIKLRGKEKEDEIQFKYTLFWRKRVLWEE